MIETLFRQHLHDIDESYTQHAGHAFHIGLRLIGSGIACLVHGLLPGLFMKTASNTLADIGQLMVRRRELAQSAASDRLGSASIMENPAN
ncbi:MAG: DUF6356 family protein [Pseudomonadales bacterium]|nr:hypothetical protein [Pseudomonadales bacterium]